MLLSAAQPRLLDALSVSLLCTFLKRLWYNVGMALFAFSATRQNGEVIKGEREAGDEKALADALRAEGLLLLSAREKATSRGILKIDLGGIAARMRPVPLAEKMFFARNLAVMVSAGLSLTRALSALGEETTNSKFKAIIADVNASVAQGKTFGDALRSHTDVFGELFINMTDVGEATGKLSLVLKLLASQMKRDRTLVKRVRGAMMYPAVIMTALVAIGILMMVYVLPTLTATIKDLGVPLPITTRVVIGASDVLRAYGLWVAVGAVLLMGVAWRVRRIPAVRWALSALALRLPLFGPLVHKVNSARFCRTLAYLTTSGVPITRSLEITAGVVGNLRFRSATHEAAQEIQKGVQLHTILAGHGDIFPALVIQMIAVGEETGKISEMLLRLALFFEEEVAGITKNLSTIIEPVLMIVIGVVVGFFAVAMLQPIYGSLGNL